MLRAALPANPRGVDAAIIAGVLNPSPPRLLQQLPAPPPSSPRGWRREFYCIRWDEGERGGGGGGGGV